MHVISLVPSWTETLIEAGVKVVGRTRFCVHPADRVADIPVVGGTKDVDWRRVAGVEPGLVIVDREENTRQIAERCPVACLATHVTSVGDVPRELDRLSKRLGCDALCELAERWRAAVAAVSRMSRHRSLTDLPGVLDWIRRPGAGVDRLVYLIWRDPWMAIGRGTFIASMLELLGFGRYLPELDGKYPEVDPGDCDSARTLLLFASEPYPFAQKRAELEALPHASAIVDGERYGWYGVRALRFLESVAE